MNIQNIIGIVLILAVEWLIYMVVKADKTAHDRTVGRAIYNGMLANLFVACVVAFIFLTKYLLTR